VHPKPTVETVGYDRDVPPGQTFIEFPKGITTGLDISLPVAMQGIYRIRPINRFEFAGPFQHHAGKIMANRAELKAWFDRLWADPICT
jgi:hypothetical protein